MTQQQPAAEATADNATPTVNAYDLLTKPTLELTDAEVEIVVADLRKRRHAYVSAKTPDRPDKPKKQPTTAQEKAANTAAIAAAMRLDFDL